MTKPRVSYGIYAPDAQPNIAPHKISNKPGFNAALLTLGLMETPDGIVPRDGVVPRDGLVPGRPTYFALRVLPGDRDLAKYGFKASVSRGLVCGIGDRCGPGRRSLVTQGTTIINDAITYAELDETSDGLYIQNIHFRTNEGWF